MMPERHTVLYLVGGLLVYGLVLVGLSVSLSHDALMWTMSEEGPFEIGSVVAWLVAAPLAFGLLRRRARLVFVVSLVVVFLACAAREADLHKTFTGRSMLQIGYYHDPAFTIGSRLTAALVMLIFTASVVRIGLAALGHLKRRSGRMRYWEAATVIIFPVIVVSKVADRAPVLAREFLDLTIEDEVRVYVKVFEEGLEAALPILAICAIVSYARTTPYKSRPGDADRVPDVERAT
jgi:hypothetical protein